MASLTNIAQALQYDQARRIREAQEKKQRRGAILSALGSVVGGLAGGPIGGALAGTIGGLSSAAAAGLGSSLGSALGGAAGSAAGTGDQAAQGALNLAQAIGGAGQFGVQRAMQKQDALDSLRLQAAQAQGQAAGALNLPYDPAQVAATIESGQALEGAAGLDVEGPPTEAQSALRSDVLPLLRGNLAAAMSPPDVAGISDTTELGRAIGYTQGQASRAAQQAEAQKQYDIIKGFEASDKLRDQALKETGDLGAIRNGYQNAVNAYTLIDDIRKTGVETAELGLMDTALVYAWAKMNDPGGRVTDSDYEAPTDVRPWLDIIGKYKDKALTGAIFNQAQREQLMYLIEQKYNQEFDNAQQSIGPILSEAKRLQSSGVPVSVDYVTPGYMQSRMPQIKRDRQAVIDFVADVQAAPTSYPVEQLEVIE